MFRINLDKHTELQKVVDMFISAMLPHEKGNQEQIPAVLKSLNSYITKEEFSLEYYILVNLVSQIADISIQTNSPLNFSFLHIDTYLSLAKLVEIIKLDGIGILNMMREMNEPMNAENPEHISKAGRIIFKKIKDLYERAMNLKISPSEIISFLPALREEYLRAISSDLLLAQETLLSADNEINKYTHTGWSEFLQYSSFKGPDGWLQLMTKAASVLSQRIDQGENGVSVITANDLTRMEEEYISNTSYISSLNIASIDNRFGITKVGYTVLVGEPKTGKTTLAMTNAARLLAEGKKVAIYSGENEGNIIMFRHLLPPYIKEKYGFYVTPGQVLGLESIGGLDDVEKEERRICINKAKLDLTESGNLAILSKALSVTDLKVTITQLYNVFPFDFLVLDHAMSLAGSEKLELEKLSNTCVELKRTLGTQIWLLWHAAPDWQKFLRGENTIITKNCGQPGADCDCMMLLFSLEEQRRNSEATIMFPYVREDNDPTERHYLKFIFAVGTYTESDRYNYEDEEDIIAEVDQDSLLDDEDGLEEEF